MQSILSELVKYDVFNNICEYLTINEILITRQLSKTWNLEGKKELLFIK